MNSLFATEPTSDAVISPCGLYRYALTRTWDVDRAGVTFVMLNPSTADATKDDATIRKCLAFARSWGYGQLTVVNLFAFRATDPAELEKAADPIGPDNNGWILRYANAGMMVAAWGSHKMAERRAREVMEMLSLTGTPRMHCLKLSKDGNPWHPLYVKGDTLPARFEAGFARTAGR